MKVMSAVYTKIADTGLQTRSDILNHINYTTDGGLE